MTKGRMEAFSDGVIAIIITIMVLELRVPHGADLKALSLLWPKIVSYALSFLFLGIYWTNHHHLIQAVKYVSGGVLWANLHLLFWLSLVPFVTGWIGETHFAALPVAVYGLVMLLAGTAYFVLTRVLLRVHGSDSTLAHAVGRDFKGQVSLAIYAAAVILAFLQPIVSCALYLLVSIMWLVPDRRIERAMAR